MRTRRFDTLTFARSTGEAEDVTLFHRGRKRNIAAYASEMKLSSRGRFFNEDDLVEYDVLDYTHRRDVLAGARVARRPRAAAGSAIKAYALAALTLRLAEEFTVQSITSDELGRLMFLRVRNQNSVVVNLPSTRRARCRADAEHRLSGPIQTQSIEQESVDVQGSGRTAAARRGHSVRPAGTKLAVQQSQPLVSAGPGHRLRDRDDPVHRARRLHGRGQRRARARDRRRWRWLPRRASRFAPRIPTWRRSRCAISAWWSASSCASMPRPSRSTSCRPYRRLRRWILRAGPPAIGARNTVALAVEANRRQQERGRDIVDTAAEILRFYASIVGDVPYDAMTIAMVEHDRPGGHSPATLPSSTTRCR